MATSRQQAAWEELGVDQERGEQWYGQELLTEFDIKWLMRDQLRWFRQAVEDVRRTLNRPDAVPVIKLIKVYRELKLKKLGRGKSLRERFTSWWHGRWDREDVGGVVRYGDPVVLYLSEKGFATPRVVYEEAAHGMLRKSTLAAVGARPSAQVRRWMEAFFRSILPEPRNHPQAEWWPFICHLEIYRGFLNNSAAMTGSQPGDVSLIRDRVRALEGNLACRVHKASHQARCPC